ncbi:Transposable element Tc1 transposase, partial [Stegodyphus mimosarum]
MPRRRKRARFEQLTEFERGRIIGLREAGLSYRAVSSRVQRNSSTVMRVWKQWTDECRTTRKSGSGPRNVTSARDDRHLVRMARTDRTASSRQLAALWSIATGVSLCASSIRRRLLQCGLRARTPLYRIPLTHDHRRLRLQWANQHRDWRADWQHVVFSDESRFNLWYHDGRIRVRRYAGERHLPECIIERHSGRTPGVMVWGAIAYHRRSQLLRIVGNLNSNRYIREVLQPEAVPFLQSLPGAVFQQDNARPHTARIVKSFFAAQQVQLLPWPACSPDMSPIEHVWDVIGRRLARDPRPVASADELWELTLRPELLVDGVSRHDIVQGVLADCWFLSSCAAVAQRPDLMEKVIPSNQPLSGEGYKGIVTFRFWRFGHWITVYIDDLLPTKKRKLIFSRSSEPREFWVSLLEKAYA